MSHVLAFSVFFSYSFQINRIYTSRI